MNEKETKIVLEENKKNGSLVLMGDFNQGPAITRGWEGKRERGGEDVYPTNYQMVIERGFVSPYVSEVGNCTKCLENPLYTNTMPYIVDHIYVEEGTAVLNVMVRSNRPAAFLKLNCVNC